MSFTVPRSDLRGRARGARPAQATSWASASVATDEAMGKVSLVGAGMKSHPGRGGQDVHACSATPA